jgi:hypothetical protein
MALGHAAGVVSGALGTVVAMANHLRRASPVTGKRLSLRKISAELAKPAT